MGPTAFTGFCVLRLRALKLDSSYLFHWLKNGALCNQRVRTSYGCKLTKRSRIELVFDSQIPLPPLAEQRRIAAILDAAEALREKRRQSLAKLDTLTQAIFLDLFGDPIIENPRRFKVKPLVEIIDLARSISLRNADAWA